jgi:hypothetical protein
VQEYSGKNAPSPIGVNKELTRIRDDTKNLSCEVEPSRECDQTDKLALSDRNACQKIHINSKLHIGDFSEKAI